MRDGGNMLSMTTTEYRITSDRISPTADLVTEQGLIDYLADMAADNDDWAGLDETVAEREDGLYVTLDGESTLVAVPAIQRISPTSFRVPTGPYGAARIYELEMTAEYDDERGGWATPIDVTTTTIMPGGGVANVQVDAMASETLMDAEPTAEQMAAWTSDQTDILAEETLVALVERGH